MKNWIKARMGEILARTSGTTVVLDPDGVLDEHAITSVAEACRMIRVDDWVSLRRVWDLDIRRVLDGPPTLIWVSSAEFATAVDLPWDIEHEADEVIRLRWPVPIELHALLRAADPTSAEKLISAADKHSDVADIVASAYGVAFGEPGPELDGVVRLRLVPETPDALWDVLARILTTPAARSVAVGRGDLAGLQRIWNDWLRHGHGDGAEAFVAAPGAVLGLLGAGLLKPAPIRAAGLPDWAQVGAVDPDPEQLIAELLAVQPALPTDLAGWTDTASWWGQVRAAIAAAANPPGNAETAWQTWERLDDRFSSLVARRLRLVATLHRTVRRIAPSRPTAGTPRRGGSQDPPRRH